MKRGKRYSNEVKDQAVRLVWEHRGVYSSQWSAISSIAPIIGCSCETLRRWVRQFERTGRISFASVRENLRECSEESEIIRKLIQWERSVKCPSLEKR